MTPITNCLKKKSSNKLKLMIGCFEEIKEKLITALVLYLFSFSKVFEIASDASGVGVSSVLSQGSLPITFFNEKLDKASNTTNERVPCDYVDFTLLTSLFTS